MRISVTNLFRIAVAVALTLCAVFMVSGCRETDVLKELINDQTSENIDYDNPIKQYNNVPDAELTSEDFPELVRKEEANIERERENTDPTLGEEDLTEQEAPDVLPQDTSVGDSKGTEQKSDSQKSDEDDQKSDKDDTKDKKDKKDKEDQGDQGDTGEGEEEEPDGGGDSADPDSKGEGDTEKQGAGGTGTTVDLSGANEPEENAYDTVVAFGECANIVAMLTGEGSLVGSDSGFLDNGFIQDAYASRGISEVARIDTQSISFDVDQVIAAKPEALLIMNGTYEVTEEQAAMLEEADIDLVYLPGINSHTSIKGVVRILGTLFGNASETPSGRDALGIANQYCEWADTQVRDISRKNGGLMTYGGLNYDTGEVDISKAISSDPAQINWGLYVYDWDFSAVYSASPNNLHLWDAQGVALAKTGYTWSPLYYYMSVGGVNNNAAQFHVSAPRPTSLFYIWQFNLSYLSTAPLRFSNVSITTSRLEDFSDNDVLVRTQDEARSYSLGCDNFRTVITKTQKITRALEQARDEGTRTQTGLYGAYRYHEEYGQTGIGLFADQNMLVPSFIGYVEGTSGTISTKKSLAYERYEKGENPYEVVTNPHGLYSSWTEGSVESVLECQWIDDLYHAGGDFSNTSNTCKEFYRTFYGYEISDDQINAIFAGLEG